jgi:superfamily II DNA/RNA helicase
LAYALKDQGFKADSLHSDLRQNVRDRVMKNFRSGELQILVATDIAARGIDVKNVDAVINYEPPREMDSYVHRIGRTGRANTSGKAFTLISSNVAGTVRELQKVAKSPIVEHMIEGFDVFAPENKIVESGRRSYGDRSERSSSGSFGGGERKPFVRETDPNKIRMFMNVGSKEGLDNDSLKQLLLTKTSLQASEIADV